MAIKINDIPPDGLVVELSETLDLTGEGTAGTTCVAIFSLKPVENGIIRLTGSLKAEPVLECSRCLKRFTLPLSDERIDIELVPGSSVRDGDEHELDRAELDVEFYEGDEIEPLDVLREQLLLDIPMVPVHSPDCKGLCPTCGTDLNERECGCERQPTDPTGPFARLKDILKKKE